MKKIFWILLLPLLFLNSCNFINSITPSKELTEFNVDIDGISHLDASGIYNVTILKGDNESCAIKCNENLKEFLDISQSGSTLHLNMDNISASSGVVLEAIVTVVDLSKISLSGVAEVTMNEINFKNLECNISGASAIKASNFTGEKLLIEASGASVVKINGTVNSFKADFSGASHLKGKNLKVKNTANINGSGACRFTIDCENEVNADLSGASSLAIYGNPKSVNEEVSGASSIKIK